MGNFPSQFVILLASIIFLCIGIAITLIDFSIRRTESSSKVQVIKTIIPANKETVANKETPAVAPAQVKRAAPVRKMTTAGADIIAIWKNIAIKNALPDKTIDLIAYDIWDICDFSDLSLQTWMVEPLELSLDRFVNQRKKELSSNNIIEVRICLSHCLHEALKRRKLSSQDKQSLLQSYEELLDEDLLPLILARIKERLPDSKFKKWERTINDGLQLVKVKVLERTKELNDDFLSPALREPLSKVECDEAIEQLGIADLYPIYDEDKGDKQYQKEVEALLQRCIDTILFNYFYLSIRNKLDYNVHWGYLLFDIQNSYGFWPARVKLKVNEYMNGKMKWERWEMQF